LNGSATAKNSGRAVEIMPVQPAARCHPAAKVCRRWRRMGRIALRSGQSAEAPEIRVTRGDVGAVHCQPHVTQYFEGSQQHGQRRPAGGNVLEMRFPEPRRQALR
jgi:hypothetical protein